MTIHKLLFFISFFIALQCLPAQTAEDRLQEAFRAQQSLKYDEAIQGYESIMKDGYFSADLYFNTAMAYYHKGTLGSAILYLEKAKRHAPYDHQINTNLSLIQNEQVDGLLPLPTFFLKSWWDNTAARLSSNTWAFLSIFFSILAATGFGLWILKKLPDLRKYQLIISPTLLTFAIFFFFLGQSRQATLNLKNEAVVTVSALDMFIAPGEDADKDGEIHAGLKVTILDQFEGWMKIRLIDGREGWVKTEGMGII